MAIISVAFISSFIYFFITWCFPKYGDIEYTLYSHGAPSISVSSDGNYITVVAQDVRFFNYSYYRSLKEPTGLFLFHISKNEPLWTYDGISSASISSDGSYIAALGDGKLYLFTALENEPLWTYDGISSASISSDGSYIVAVGENGKLYLFSVSDNKPRWIREETHRFTLSAHENYIIVIENGELHLFSDEKLVWAREVITEVTISADKVHLIRQSSLIDGIQQWENRVIDSWVQLGMAALLLKRTILIGEGNVEMFDDNRLSEVWKGVSTITLSTPGWGPIAISPNGRYLTAVDGGHNLYLLSSDNQLIWRFKDDARSVRTPCFPSGLAESPSCLVGIIVSDNGNVVANAKDRVYFFSKGENLAVWWRSFSRGTWKGTEMEMVHPLSDVVMSQDGRYIAVSAGEHIHLFDKNGNLLWSFRGKFDIYGYNFTPLGYKEILRAVSLSAGGTYVVAASEGGPHPNTWGSVYLFSKKSNLPLWSYHFEGVKFQMI